MELEQDYFTLFGLPAAYHIDLAKIGEHYLHLQRQFHPDKYASASAQEQLLAAQITAYVNEAQRVLKDDVLRAEYLLHLKGNQQSLENNTMADGAFLMMQMELREKLESASTEEMVEDLIDEVETMQDNLSEIFANVYEDSLEQGFATLQKMKFFQRLSEQAEDRLDDLSD